MKKFMNLVKKYALPLSGVAAALCLFVAEHSANLCMGFWAYEEEMPECLKKNV